MSILPKFFCKPLVGLSVMTALAFGAACWADEGSGGTAPKKSLEPEFTIKVEVPKGSNEGTLTISAKIPISPNTGKPYHIYSTNTNGVNAGRATKVVLDKGSPWQLLGTDFTADHKPHPAQEEGGDDKLVPVEHFEKKVTWKRQVRLKDGVDPETAPFSGTVRGQMCDEKNCRIIRHKFKTQVTVLE